MGEKGEERGMEWVADGEKEGKREKEGGCRTKDKECGT